MPSKQDRIFQDKPEPDEKPDTNRKFHLGWAAAPFKATIQAFKNVTLLAAFTMFLWGMCEQFLPHEFRLTTFIGERVKNLGNIENIGTAKTAAQKAEAVITTNRPPIGCRQSVACGTTTILLQRGFQN